jgi:hypothetical protein
MLSTRVFGFVGPKRRVSVPVLSAPALDERGSQSILPFVAEFEGMPPNTRTAALTPTLNPGRRHSNKVERTGRLRSRLCRLLIAPKYCVYTGTKVTHSSLRVECKAHRTAWLNSRQPSARRFFGTAP